jgi:minor extracellular serine protease Vpr
MRPSKPVTHTWAAYAQVLTLCITLAAAGRTLAVDPSELALPGGATTTTQPRFSSGARKIASGLASATGPVEVWVKLSRPSLVEANGANAKTRGGLLTRGERRAHLDGIARDQDALASGARSLGGVELGRVSKAHNAVAIRIDASRLRDLANQPGVEAIRQVRHYTVALSETVPYIGAAAAQAAGKDGTGARVAVIDSGADYTHAFLGGSGNPADYITATTTFPNAFFPNAKVIGGFDFVGSTWPNGPRTEDPNPIDDGTQAGHGTHVSDIIAGRSADGAHKGVAPGAKLYAIKVCSSVSTSCNGVALLKAVDFALDPNGDGTLEDAVDVMNLSLGSGYGQQEDDLTEALNQAVAHGVVVACAAGNDGNKPYVLSSPSSGPPIISVAQTQVPSAKAIPLIVNSPAAIAGTYANTETVTWAPVDHAVTGDVAFVGRGCPAGSITATNPDDPFIADPSGKVALIDRGACSVSLKVDRAARAGATAVIIGLVAPGDPVSFSFGGGTTFVPTLIITQADSRTIKGSLTSPVNVTISAASAISLVGSMASTSARGPSYSLQTIKPEIGAPGASVSAVAGTGTGQEAFGGTSGATPMISGSAAILIGAQPRLEPAQVKALLMNNAETRIFHQPALFPGKLAPITRIGAGEVRVDRALAATTAAWVEADQSAAVSFGYHAVGDRLQVARVVHVQNLASGGKTFQISSAFRTPAKLANAAVEIRAPRSLRVPGRGTANFEVKISIDPRQLPDWNLDGGPNGGNGLRLDDLEVDGYLTLAAGSERLTLPWHVLPHKAAVLRAKEDVEAGKELKIKNSGAANGFVEVFALTGTSPQIPGAQLPGPGDAFAVIDLQAVGAWVVSDSAPNDTLQFGISTFGARSHPNYPAEFDILVDTNRDGVPDFDVFNLENVGFAATGQNVVAVQALDPDGSANGPARVFFFTDADLNSSNAIFTVPLAALGITADTTINFSVLAFDNYFTGNLTDSIEDMTFTPSRPQFTTSALPDAGIPPGGVARVTVTRVAGGAQASPSQTGLLLLFRDSDARDESQAVVVRR